MDLRVVHRNTRAATLEQRFPGIRILDVTSRAEQPWVRFSPFYPHGGIPVPFSDGQVAQSVEGVWQGLKVFADSDVDVKMFGITTMRGLKRTERRFGRTLGHRAGVHGDRLLSYLGARRLIYLPIYRWVLDNKLQPELEQVRELARQHPVALLDYETNTDVLNPAKPLSHAALVRAYVLGEWPVMDPLHS
ncbi:DUF6939 family protein [Deinococcus altitudinis]|uniref:DUF6939 family protein n=1 Tax=Deinococcus altitudinis TaxID=468914 RepID=UPI0038926D2C